MGLPITDANADVLERMVLAVELVKQRLLRASRALQSAGIPYAIAGGNAVAAWVAKVDMAAVRNTADVDIIIRREDFASAKTALESAGFDHRHAAGLDIFIDRNGGSQRDGIHLLFAGDIIKKGDLLPVPDVDESESLSDTRFLSLLPLVRYKLVSYRDKDRTHLRDMIGLEMIDESWLAKLPSELAARLKHLLDNPE